MPKPRAPKTWVLRFAPKVPPRKMLTKKLKVNSAFEQIELARRKGFISLQCGAKLNREVLRFSRSRRLVDTIRFVDSEHAIVGRIEIRNKMVTLFLDRTEFREAAD